MCTMLIKLMQAQKFGNPWQELILPEIVYETGNLGGNRGSDDSYVRIKALA